MVAPHVAFDLETRDASQMYSCPPEEFFRVGGYACSYGDVPVTDGAGRHTPGVRITTDSDEILRVFDTAKTIAGHNIAAFDVPVLQMRYGSSRISVVDLAEQGRLRDTMLTAMLDDPPSARMNAGQIDRHYSLSAVADRMFGESGTKFTKASKALTREYGGWDHIPPLDWRFQVYLDADVSLTDRLAVHLCDPDRRLWPYAEREHSVAAVCSQISMNGFRIDEDLVRERYEAGQRRKKEIIDWLTSEHGLPTARKDGSPSASPQNTEAGRQAVKTAFEALGAKYMPKTDKGAWATGKEAMDRMIDYYGSSPKAKLTDKQRADVLELCQTVKELNGVRTIYETVWNSMVQDPDEAGGGWRVHPAIAARQASGRLSFTKPGLTVMGKRAGRHVEREIFLPEDGHVVITCDLSQIDARAVAVHSQDPAYMAMFDPGKDLHSEIALRVFGTTAMREQAKPCSHGWNYGLGPAGMVEQMGVDPKIAHTFAEQMREQFPRLVEWKEEMAEIAASGRLLDNGFGRKMRPDRRRAFTQGPALMGQGCARDLLCEGVLRLIRRYPETLPMLRGIIHDEIVLSVPVELADDVEKAAVESLSFDWAPETVPNARPIAVTADVGKRGTSWGACYEK